MPQQFVLRTWS